MSETIRSSRDVIIRCEQWQKAVDFYRDVLGFKATQHSDRLIGFETGSLCLYVEAGADHAPVFDFLVSDVEATKHRLLAAGCELIEEDTNVPRCYLRDPFGLLFNLGKAG